MSNDSKFWRKSDPRLLTHDGALALQNHRILIDGTYYTYAYCPGTCGRTLLRRLNHCIWEAGIPKSKTRCRSCVMKGKKNRTPTHAVGEIWKCQSYWLTKLADGTIHHVARLLMVTKLQRQLTSADRIRYLDNNPDNLDPGNLILESELIEKLRQTVNGTPSDLRPFNLSLGARKTPHQVAADALAKIKGLGTKDLGTKDHDP